jgi:hypothetical protein
VQYPEKTKALFFNIVLFIIFLFSILIIVKPLYDIFVINTGHSINQYYLYFLFIFISLTLPALVAIFQDKRKLNIFLMLTVNIFCLYSFEIFLELRNIFSNDLIGKAKKEAIKLNIDFDNRSRIDILDSLSNAGFNAHAPIGPGHLFCNIKYRDGFVTTNDERIFPLGGISNSFTTFDNSNGYYPIIALDKYGFNNQKEIYDLNNIDVALIGDSFTEGFSVNPDQSISGRMNRLGINTISLGKAGNGPLTELATLIEYCSILQPRVIIWLYCSNDLEYSNLPNELNSTILLKYLNDKNYSQDLIKRQNEIDSLMIKYLNDAKKEYKIVANTKSSAFRSIKEIVRLWNFRSFLIIDNRHEDTIDWATPFKEFELILTRAKETVSNWEGKLIFFYIPDYQEFVEPFQPHHFKQEVLDIVHRLDIPIIDGKKDIFDMQKTPLSLFPFGLPLHFNKDGYKLLTNSIIENLTIKD